MWPTRNQRLTQLDAALENFSRNKRVLLGINDPAARRSLAMQMVASLRRLEYTARIKSRPVDPRRAAPNDPMFDPERAIIYHIANRDVDEAAWLLFLTIHFGKNLRHGWRRLREVYSGLGSKTWTWKRVSSDVPAFREWLEANRAQIGGAFGNHRKYESLSGSSDVGTGAAVASYVNLIGPSRSHEKRFADLVREGGNDPHSLFDAFYKQFNILRFGRLAKFEFLALIGRFGLAPIEPGSTYLQGATGPLKGARLLFGGSASAPLRVFDLEEWLRELDVDLNIGMQAMEDALCNWQKSPGRFKHFRG